MVLCCGCLSYVIVNIFNLFCLCHDALAIAVYSGFQSLEKEPDKLRFILAVSKLILRRYDTVCFYYNLILFLEQNFWQCFASFGWVFWILVVCNDIPPPPGDIPGARN